ALPAQQPDAARSHLRRTRQQTEHRSARRLRRRDPRLFRHGHAAPGDVRHAEPPHAPQLGHPRRSGALVARQRRHARRHALGGRRSAPAPAIRPCRLVARACRAVAPQSQRPPAADRHRPRADVRASGRGCRIVFRAQSVGRGSRPHADSAARRHDAPLRARAAPGAHARPHAGLTHGMRLDRFYWFVVVASLVACYAPAAFYIKRSASSTAEFFTSGRAAPWWLVGTSMVATTFSTDTPNLVTDFVRSHGVSYNWDWWAFLLTGMATVFFYARLWRRSGVLTDLEFYELRYSGRSAAMVRGFRSVYLGFFFNIAIMSTVTLAAIKIANVMLGWGRLETVAVAGTACVIVAALTGLWGVLATDLVQFALAMVGVTIAAYVALDHPAVGGLHALLRKTPPATLALLPDFGDHQLTLAVLIIPLTVQWWSVWYPGAEPGGGSYIAQRILASKNERHALGATLWFNVAHYALRPWPWIIVALASMLV